MFQRSLNYKLRLYFNKNLLFTVDKLAELMGKDKKDVRVAISRMKNPKYANKKEERLDIIQDISLQDGKKRWGIRGATKYADKEKFNKVTIEKEVKDDK